jgi:hypothetical protein
MDNTHRRYYTTDILEKLKKIGYDEECLSHNIYDSKTDSYKWTFIPTPEEFFKWLITKNNQFYISIIPEDDYKYSTVFRYNIYKRDYDDHYNLKLSNTSYLTHTQALWNAIYDLLMNFETK